MTQSVYYQRVKVNAYCFVTSSLPGIYKSLTDYCNSSEDINENFILAVSQTPIGMTLYQPFWLSAFSNQSIQVGSSWNYNYQGSSIAFDVTDTRTVAGINGYVIETQFTESGESINWYTCINQEIPLPLLASIDYGEQGAYHIELTGYEE
jgi:hypothetical protein